MEGQWIGTVSSGENQGLAIIDVDKEVHQFRGTARLFIEGEPGVTCEFETGNTGPEFKCENVLLHWIPEGQPVILDAPQIKERHPDYDFPQTVSLRFSPMDQELEVEWSTNLGSSGKAVLHRSQADKPSSLTVLPIMDWQEFKKFALEQQARRYVYRGQAEAFKLRTLFHRSHRKDLVKYAIVDIPLAYRTLMARTKHLFDLSKPEQFGAFWNLLQHHGYPTPLLDWTYSPFVAAFFAYRKRQIQAAPSNKVRIFAFDKLSWSTDFPQLQAVNFAQLHFSILEALAIENDRALPQQSLSTLSNTDDIEAYIRSCEETTGKTYLSAIDLPADQRRDVMVELSLMGITAGSLFPGLDGACEELKGRMFHP